jgi:uncharacterized protein (DUF1919 family)
MNSEKLTDENFVIFCAKYYNGNGYYTTEDFVEDLNRIKYIKKLVTRYIENDDLKERLILNHIIILNNCFGNTVLCKILLLKLRSQMQYLKPFLVALNYLPEKIYNVGDEFVIHTDDIPMDSRIVNRLREMFR